MEAIKFDEKSLLRFPVPQNLFCRVEKIVYFCKLKSMTL